MPVPQYLEPAIEVVHAGMQEEQDPKHVQTLSGCLRALTGIQADYMSQQGGGAASAGGGDRRSAVLAQLAPGG